LTGSALGGGRLDDAKQAIGACAIDLALLALWGCQLQAAAKRCRLATHGIKPLFEFGV